MAAPNISQPTSYRLLAQVEGESWVAQQDQGGKHTYRSAHAEWLRCVDRAIDDAIEFDDASCLDDNRGTSAVIYGLGGATRYFVRLGGDIVFSQRHGAAHTERTARAAALGFRVE